MNLSEAYQNVYSSQEVDEAVKGQDSEMRKVAAVERAAERKSGSKAQSPGREGPSAGKSYADYQKISIDKHDKVTKKNKNVVGLVAKEEVDIFDTVIEYLQVEGIAESFEDAQWMMANVIDEEDIDSILDEARRADKEGYARGSKENPKRKDIPHGDVSQRSMLHSKLKRRADEMGRARRSSARNKAGGRTPVGKKEKAFLQAVTRTAGQVHNPNVPDTGKHKK